MRKESFEFLRELVAAPSPSGYEQPAQRVFRAYIASFARVSQDASSRETGAIDAARVGTALQRYDLFRYLE